MSNTVEEQLLSSIKKPKQIGTVIYVYDGNNKLVGTQDALNLAKKWFNMSNDIFFETYGFNWVPTGRIYDLAREAKNKNIQDIITNNMQSNFNNLIGGIGI